MHNHVPDLPIKPKARFVTRGGYTTAYFVEGPENGRPLMLCHGLAANGLQFVEDSAFFANLGFRVIVPDLRGHGRSTCPKVRADEDFVIPQLAADLIAILDAETIEAIDWVGNSLGGIVALCLMGSDAHRLKKVMTFGTSYSLKAPTMLVPGMKLVFQVFGRAFIASLGAPMTCRRPEAKAIIKEMLSHIDIDAVLRTAKALVHYDFISTATAFDRSILMIRGARDRDINKALAPTLAAMGERPNFTILDLEDAGHCANLDRPKAVRGAILDFIAEA